MLITQAPNTSAGAILADRGGNRSRKTKNRHQHRLGAETHAKANKPGLRPPLMQRVKNNSSFLLQKKCGKTRRAQTQIAVTRRRLSGWGFTPGPYFGFTSGSS